MEKLHHFKVDITWTGNKGSGTSEYSAYTRDHLISAENKPDMHCSSDPAFRGDKTKYNPEDLLIASLASCHMLWYLHLCADAGIIVTDYADNASGIMVQNSSGGGQFQSVTLRPVVTLTDGSMIAKANALHKEANAHCFIANSMNFKVNHEPVCKAQ